MLKLKGRRRQTHAVTGDSCDAGEALGMVRGKQNGWGRGSRNLLRKS